jgi:hypothetical protein
MCALYNGDVCYSISSSDQILFETKFVKTFIGAQFECAWLPKYLHLNYTWFNVLSSFFRFVLISLNTIHWTKFLNVHSDNSNHLKTERRNSTMFEQFCNCCISWTLKLKTKYNIMATFAIVILHQIKYCLKQSLLKPSLGLKLNVCGCPNVCI